MFTKSFVAACAVGAVVAHKHQTFEKDHHKRAANSPEKPENNLWNQYWADQEHIDNASILGCLSCTAATDTVSSLLKNPVVHETILKLASAVCILSGGIGHRF